MKRKDILIVGIEIGGTAVLGAIILNQAPLMRAIEKTTMGACLVVAFLGIIATATIIAVDYSTRK